MHILKSLVLCFLTLTSCFVSAAEFTIASYNCGGLSEHYDYLKAASMQKIMQERSIAEPGNMSLNEKIQKVALKILFSQNPQEKMSAQEEWDREGYQQQIEYLTTSPTQTNSLNTNWNLKINNTITSYKVRPVSISDPEVNQMLNDHLNDLSGNKKANRSQLLTEVRAIMAKRIFAHHLKHDIICLQEADYLDASLFPSHYKVLFSDTSHSQNGIAWNTERFELVEAFGDILGRAFAVQLHDKVLGKTLLVASGHITGCNPYRVEIDAQTGVADSAKGDTELQTVVDLFESLEADLLIIGMDSNVTSLHPRLNILKDAGYQMDADHFLEPTCTNPNLVLDTRIDWIALKATQSGHAVITNIPVLSVGLNNLQTNISDHKPVAAKIEYYKNP